MIVSLPLNEASCFEGIKKNSLRPMLAEDTCVRASLECLFGSRRATP